MGYGGWRILGLFLVASLLGKGKSKPVLIAGLTYIVVSIVSLLVLGQIFGPIGLAVTLIIAQTVQAADR